MNVSALLGGVYCDENIDDELGDFSDDLPLNVPVPSFLTLSSSKVGSHTKSSHRWQ